MAQKEREDTPRLHRGTGRPLALPVPSVKHQHHLLNFQRQRADYLQLIKPAERMESPEHVLHLPSTVIGAGEILTTEL